MPADATHADLAEGIDPVLFGPALALALRLSGEAVTRMNFRRGEFAYRQNLRAVFGSQLRPTAVLAAILVSLLFASTLSGIVVQNQRTSSHREAAAALYHEAFPERTTSPANPATALRGELSAAQERAEFLGLYSGNRSALNLLGSSRPYPVGSRGADHRSEHRSQRDPPRRRCTGYEAADRLTSVLSETSPFRAEVAGPRRIARPGAWTVNSPLATPGEEA